MHIILFLEVMHTMTLGGEIPRYLGKIYLPYSFLLSFSLPATHHDNFCSFGYILTGFVFCGTIINISVVSYSVGHTSTFVLEKIKDMDCFSHFQSAQLLYILVSCSKFIMKQYLFTLA